MLLHTSRHQQRNQEKHATQQNTQNTQTETVTTSTRTSRRQKRRQKKSQLQHTPAGTNNAERKSHNYIPQQQLQERKQEKTKHNFNAREQTPNTSTHKIRRHQIRRSTPGSRPRTYSHAVVKRNNTRASSLLLSWSSLQNSHELLLISKAELLF